MIEFLVFIAVIIIVVVAIKLGKQDNVPTARPSGLPDGLKMARKRAEESGDTEAVQAIDNGTYKELLEQRAAKRQSTLPAGFDVVTFDIAGINYRKGIADYVGDSTGYLKPQPTNRHDPNAIAIYSDDDHHLGYIRANDTGDLRALRLRFPIPVSVSIEECYDNDDNRRFFVGSVTIKMCTKSVENKGKNIKNGNKMVTI